MVVWWALACATHKKAEPAAATDPGGAQSELLVWRVDKRRVDPSYFMGTCHLQVPLERWLPPPHDRALERSRVAYTEIGDQPIDLAAMLALIPVREVSLRDELGIEAFDDVSRKMAHLMPATILDVFPAWMAYSMLDLEELARRLASLQVPESPLLDGAVVVRAAEARVEVRALETVESQVALFSSFQPVFEQALAAGSATAERSQRQIDDVVELCSTFEIASVEASLAEPDPTGFTEALLGQRNRAWMVTLRPELERGGVFVAVGAAHLLGSDGLLAAARADGFTVERLVGSVAPADAAPSSSPPPTPPGPAAPELVDHWADRLSAELTPSICEPEGLMRTCFGLDEVSCPTEMTRAAEMCVAQQGDRLPPLDSTLDPELLSGIATCMPGGAIFRGIFGSAMGDAPMCDMIRSVMEEAMQSMMGTP
jgi:uncharacterized protein YbaP (TraB family)